MHGRDPSSKKRPRSTEWNFGLIALVVLGLLSIAALWFMPDIFTQ
jgi:hypothetical protein